MSGAGDLVTVLSLEDFEFRTGLRNAAGETKKFGSDVNAVSRQVEGAMGGIKGSFKEGLSGLAEGGAVTGATGALSSLNSSITGVISTMGPWGFVIGTVAGVLGDQLITRLRESSKAADEFTDSMQKSETALDKLIAKENSGAAFGRNLKNLKEKGSVADVINAQESNQARTEDLQNELDRRKAAFRNNIEGARDQGLIPGVMRGAGIFDANNNLTANIELDPGKLGKGLVDEQEKIKELEDALNRAKNRAEALNGAMADAKAREEIDRQNQALKELSKQTEQDWAEIEKIQNANMTPAEKRQAEIDRLTALKERNPNAAADIDLAIANLDKKPAASEVQAVAATQFGSSSALSNIFAAQRTKSSESEQAKTNELLDEGLQNDLLTIDLLEEMRDRFAELGLAVGEI